MMATNRLALWSGDLKKHTSSSQEPAIGLYLEPNEVSSHPDTLLL
jgi:hypothetical protein